MYSTKYRYSAYNFLSLVSISPATDDDIFLGTSSYLNLYSQATNRAQIGSSRNFYRLPVVSAIRQDMATNLLATVCHKFNQLFIDRRI